MALTRTQRIASTSAATFGAGAYTTASFTPSDNSILVVVCAAIQTSDTGMEGTDLTITDSAGLTWTSRAATTGSPAWSYGCRIWTAPVTTGVSMTVSVDCGAFSMEFYRVEVFDYTSDTGSADVGGNAAGTDADGDGAASITLSATPATSSHVLAVCMTGLGGASGTITSGSGFTEVNESVMTSWAVVETETRTGSTSTTVDWVDVLATGTGFGGSVLAAVEITEVSSASTDQEGFRFGEDDANEASHTWTGAQDTNITAVAGAKLLRVLVDATDDPASAAYTLRAQKNGSGGYAAVPVGSTIPEVYGTVTFGAIGTGANGSTTVAPNYPAGIAAGQYLLCIVTSGATNSETPTTPSGWTLLATGASTDGSYGIDTGPRRVTAFGRVADGTESGTLTVSITNGGTCRGTISRFTRAGSGTWTVSAQGGDDSTSGTGFSATLASMNWNTGDVAIVAVGQRVDTATQSSQALSATGVTFGARTNRASTAVTTGNDHRHVVDTFAAVTGTSNVNAAPTWAYTASASVSGGVVIIRLREYTAPINNEVYVSTSSNITAGGEATTARLTAPAGKSTSDFVTGRRWDDENGTDTIDITIDDYTEVEWSVTMAGSLSNGDYFDFRVYAGASALDSYSTTARWTIGSGGGGAGQLVNGCLVNGLLLGSLTR